MTYTDEELVRELEWRYSECTLAMDACKRLLEYSEESISLRDQLQSALEYAEDLECRIIGLECVIESYGY